MLGAGCWALGTGRFALSRAAIVTYPQCSVATPDFGFVFRKSARSPKHLAPAVAISIHRTQR